MRDLAADVQLDLARVEFSLFHVETGIQLNLWAGDIVPGGWQSNSGPEFTIRCSDPLASPFMIYPIRTIDRKCGARYDDGHDCPFTDEGELDLEHFPDADAATCDRGYDTPNGCLAHGMKKRYRGLPLTPQPVRFKDNSSGWHGIGRNEITSVSLVSDSIFGAPLPEIYTDIPMPVNALMADGRDNGDFYEALGVLGEGPLTTIDTKNSAGLPTATLDGQPQHNFPEFAGRLVVGEDPADLNEPLSLSYDGDQVNGDFRKLFLETTPPGATFADNFSAGVAFAVIRRTDEKGLQLTRLDDHAMQIVVSGGLKGWVWTGPGERTSELLTNPVWIAINAYLKSLGLKNADPDEQEATFDLQAAIDSAAICDLRVDRIVGNTTGFTGGAVSGVWPTNRGAGYAEGDIVIISGGDGAATARITSPSPFTWNSVLT